MLSSLVNTEFAFIKHKCAKRSARHLTYSLSFTAAALQDWGIQSSRRLISLPRVRSKQM